MDFARLGMQGGQPRFAEWQGQERGDMGGVMRPAKEIDLAAHPDARLIAAAPALYEVLVDLLERVDAANESAGEYDADPFPSSLVAKARKALAQARGEGGLAT